MTAVIFAMQRSTRGLTPVIFHDGLPRSHDALEFATPLPPEWQALSLSELAAAYWRLRKAGALPANVVRK
jgi:hypothetical protein